MSATARRLKRAGIVAVFTLGFAGLATVLSGPGPNTIGPAIAVFGWFILAPYVALFDLPVIDDGSTEEAADRSPLETLRDRYAAGEISEAEFDRKVERLLATESGSSEGPVVDRPPEPLDRSDPAGGDSDDSTAVDGDPEEERDPDPALDLETE